MSIPTAWQLGKLGHLNTTSHRPKWILECFNGYDENIHRCVLMDYLYEFPPSGTIFFNDININIEKFSLDKIDYIILTLKRYSVIKEELTFENLKIETLIPSEEEIRLEAYYLWEKYQHLSTFIVGCKNNEYFWNFAANKLNNRIKVEYKRMSKGRKVKSRTLDDNWES